MQAGQRENASGRREGNDDAREGPNFRPNERNSQQARYGPSNASPGNNGPHSTGDIIFNFSTVIPAANDSTAVASSGFVVSGGGAENDTDEARRPSGIVRLVDGSIGGGHNPTSLSRSANATTAPFRPTHSDHLWTNASSVGDPSQNQTPARGIARFPKSILRRVFALVTRRSYAARLSLPLVCRAFRDVVSDCPEMWDTFEVMTGNDGALTTKRQVEYVAGKAASAPLSVALMIASSRMGAWKSETLSPRSAATGLEEESARPTANAQTVQTRGLNMIGTVLSLMNQTEELILDVQDDPLEPEIARAVLALFDDRSAHRLKRLTLLGDYQMDRIIRLKTPLSTTPPSTQPSLSSLRHLTVAYCPAFHLPAPLPMIKTLEVFIITIEKSADSHPLEEMLRSFPNLRRLTMRIIVDATETEETTILGILPHRNDPPNVKLNQLAVLHLDSLPLTSSLLSSITAPNLQTLIIRDISLGFDPRDVRYEMSLSGHLTPHLPADPPSTHSSLQPLPFGTFLARHTTCRDLRSVTLGCVPDMVVRMCVDFVRMVEGARLGGARRGVTHLSLIGFEWRDWEGLFTPQPSPPIPSSSSGSTHADRAAKNDAKTLPTVPLPHIRSVSVFLDHASTWTSRGTVAVDPEAKHDRDGWMDGLMRFAERRMNADAVVRMFKESKMDVAEWMRDPPEAGGRGDEGMRGGGVGGDMGGCRGSLVRADPLRTVMSIELDAGYKDSYAFVHGAWQAMEREQLKWQREPGLDLAESGSTG